MRFTNLVRGDSTVEVPAVGLGERRGEETAHLRLSVVAPWTLASLPVAGTLALAIGVAGAVHTRRILRRNAELERQVAE